MLEYAQENSGATLGMLVLHDDAEREYAYGPAQGLPPVKLSPFSQATYDEAIANGWSVISMKNDWKRIFGFETPDLIKAAGKRRLAPNMGRLAGEAKPAHTVVRRRRWILGLAARAAIFAIFSGPAMAWPSDNIAVASDFAVLGHGSIGMPASSLGSAIQSVAVDAFLTFEPTAVVASSRFDGNLPRGWIRIGSVQPELRDGQRSRRTVFLRDLTAFVELPPPAPRRPTVEP